MWENDEYTLDYKTWCKRMNKTDKTDKKNEEEEIRSENMSKKIEIIRGGQKRPLICSKDAFNSIINVYEGNKIIYTASYVNTDFYNGYQGGILKEGLHSGVFGIRSNGKKAIFIFNDKYKNEVKKLSDMTEEMRVLESLIANPNHENKYIITQVLIHTDGYNGGYSQGCITIYPDQWNAFENLFNIDECVDIELKRDSNWIAPDYYNGK